VDGDYGDGEDEGTNAEGAGEGEGLEALEPGEQADEEQRAEEHEERRRTRELVQRLGDKDEVGAADAEGHGDGAEPGEREADVAKCLAAELGVGGGATA
jgi:hypothetical protein